MEWHERHDGDLQTPDQGRVAVRKLKLDGDGQADLKVHGGADKAIYCCPVEHYDYRRSELPGREWSLGMFSENFKKANLRSWRN